MDRQFNTPSEIIEANIGSGVTKANMNIVKMIILGMLAGAFIAVGGTASNVAVHNISNVGVARALAGAIFPVGLMLVVMTGSELFTGNCLMVTAFLDKKIKGMQMLRNLVIVYISNLAGSVIIAGLVYLSGQFNYTDGMLGAYTIKVALAKTTIAPGTAIASGILCNMLVCLAVILALSAKDIIGKIFGIFFPIASFVICGFEHCVANMYYIPAGMFAAGNKDYLTKAQELYGITAEQCAALSSPMIIRSFICVTLGNIIGGVVCVGIPLYAAHRRAGNRK